MIIVTNTGVLEIEKVLSLVLEWEGSSERQRLKKYREYYETENPALMAKVRDRAYRGKTPNYFVPTAYYSTLVDTMAGYMFQNVQYLPVEDGGAEALISVLQENHVEIRDMIEGTQALTYNRAVEYVYTSGPASAIKYKFSKILPEDIVLIYSEDIDPELWCGLRLYTVDDGYTRLAVDAIYADHLTTYHIDKNDKISFVEEKQLLFSEVPIVVYNTEIISEYSSFNSVIPYIEALDWLISGNTNELDRLVDALLVLGKRIKPEDLEHADEWKTLEGYKTDDRAEFLNKEMSPEFREYVSKLLIQEIHKHSHIVDWYSPDTGLSGAVSGKALKTRLFDMNMFSLRIEKVYRIGLEKRLRLLSELLGLAEGAQGELEIKFNRMVPSDLEDKILALNNASFLTDETKVIELGLSWETELERREAEAARGPVAPIDFEGSE